MAGLPGRPGLQEGAQHGAAGRSICCLYRPPCIALALRQTSALQCTAVGCTGPSRCLPLPLLRLSWLEMDWEEEELSATQLQALEQAEQAYNIRRSGGSEAQGPPVAAAELAADQASVQALVPAGRRRLPAVLSAPPPTAAASGGAGQAATARATAAAAADENLPPACFGGTLRYAFTG